MYYIEVAPLHGTIPQVLVLFANGLEQLSFHESKRSKLHDKQLRCVKQSRCIPKDAYTVYDFQYTSGIRIEKQRKTIVISSDNINILKYKSSMKIKHNRRLT